MGWIWRDDRLIEKGSAEDVATRPRLARSGLPAPMLARDAIDGVRSMADGKVYDSRSALYRSYRQQGVRIVEKGEWPANQRSDMSRADVLEAVAKVRAGYKPAPLAIESPGATLEQE